MISSLTSKFKYFDRRALFISAHKAAVYHWNKGKISSSYLFDVNEEGREHFKRYLAQTANSPVYIMVDVFEEEYRRETVPHVMGSDRKTLLERKTDRLFRDTQYIYNETQGREEQGRRDDNILLTAITNPGVIKPWIEMMNEHKTPVAGIYSLPLLVSSLLKSRPEPSNHILLVSLQSISGLRQTFIQNGELRISRLVQMPRFGTTPYAPYISEEVEKIQRYLNSLRLIPPDESLEICFLMAGDLKEEIAEGHEDSELIKYHVLEINELATEVGLETNVTSPFSDQLFVSHLLKKTPANQYGADSERRYFSMRRMKYSMLVMSMIFVLAGVLWSGYNLFSGLSFKQQSIAADLRQKFYSARYNMARERLPETPVEPMDLQQGVELSNSMKSYKTTPIDTVKAISRGLNQFPRVKLKSVSWVSTIDPNVELGGELQLEANKSKIGFSQVSYTDTGYRFYHVALIDGYLDPFQGDYRRAIETINELAVRMGEQKSVHDVAIISLPLDVSSSTSLTGDAQSTAKLANFSIRIVIGVGDEA
ncbi:MAG: hypothetical protein GKR93_04305 [Gammaproteobacteria bacterium]|nr:hypothetical protein [Gammaproteobacteria bacterium]